MGLRSMQMTEAQKRQMNSPCSPTPTKRKYPWGLTLDLEGPQLKALGLTDPEAGEELVLEVRVVVTRVNSSSDTERPASVSAGLQVTHMGIVERAESADDEEDDGDAGMDLDGRISRDRG